MKKRLLSILLFTAMPITFLNAQVVLFSENFETGGTSFSLNTSDLGGIATGDNQWIINAAYLGGIGTFPCALLPVNFPFVVPPSPLQPSGITSSPMSNYLHIAPKAAIVAGGNTPAASYLAPDGVCALGGQSAFTKMSSDVSTIGLDSVEFDLWWDCGGSEFSYGEVYYSINGGSTWTIVNNPVNSTAKWKDQTTWINSKLSMAAWGNQATLRFGFKFITGTTSGTETDPGFSVDDLKIVGHSTCTPSYGTDVRSECSSLLWIDGVLYNSNNTTATHTLVGGSSNGCDSIVTLNLSIANFNATVSVSNATLTCDQSATAYQWLDCGNGNAVISGATNQSFTPTVNGSYGVIAIDANGCSSSSACATIANVSVESVSKIDFARLYPNPTSGKVTITMDESASNVTVTVRDLTGKSVSGMTFLNTSSVELDIKGESGVYFVEVITGNAKKTFKILKK